MQVLLDGQPVVVPRASLASALAAASDAARQRGRVIIEVRADGSPLSEEQFRTPSDEPGRYRELSLISADPRALLKVTFDDGAQALRALVDEQRRVAILMHSDGGEQEALAGLQSIFQTWQMIRDIVDRGAALIELDLSTFQFEGAERSPSGGTASAGSVKLASNQLIAQLRQVRDGLARKDWSMVSDLLEYDLCDQARTWERMLSALADHAGALPAGRTAMGGAAT